MARETARNASGLLKSLGTLGGFRRKLDIVDRARRAEVLQEIGDLNRSDALDLVRFMNECRDVINTRHVTENAAQGTAADPLGRWAAQSQIFVVDCVPVILELLRKNHKRADSTTLLDVGSGTGAGTSLLSSLLSSDMLWCPVKVTGIDLYPHRLICAANNFANFDYQIGNVFALEETFDYVFCSHVIEHVPDLSPFLRRLAKLARKNVIVYAPYDERERIAGHVNTITEETFQGFEIERIEVRKSAGWRWGKPETDMCILAVLKGTAGDMAGEA